MREPPISRGVPFWLWLNVLSLDAPLIAILWQQCVAHAFNLPICVSGRTMLFLTAWSIYLIDRLLDARALPLDPDSPHHFFYGFYRLHRRIGWQLLSAVLAADAIICTLFLRERVVFNGLALSFAVAAYLAAVHLLPASSRRFPKEESAAIIFAAGTFLAPWSSHPTPWTGLLGPLLAFAALCLANLTAIEVWEWRELKHAGVPKPAAMTRGLGSCYLLWVPILTLAAALCSPRSFFMSLAVSGAALTALFASERRIQLGLRRVLADVALVTPVFFLRL